MNNKKNNTTNCFILGNLVKENKMGCDLHLHVEIKIKGNDEWQHYNHPNGLYAGTRNKRNYGLFAKMANVRNDEREPIEPICLPKGLPEDITLVTKIDHERDNYHDESWFNLKEIEKLNKWWDEDFLTKDVPGSWFEEYFGYLFGNTFCKHTLELNNLTDVRFVFWFDN